MCYNTWPTVVKKIDPITMTASCYLDGWIFRWSWNYRGWYYIYVGDINLPTVYVRKILASTMALVSTWTGGALERRLNGVLYADGYVYAQCTNGPGVARLVKIDITTMTQWDIWIGLAGDIGCGPLTFDGTYLYLFTGGSHTLYKIKSASPIGAVISVAYPTKWFYSLAYIGGQLLAGILDNTTPTFNYLNSVDTTTLVLTTLWSVSDANIGEIDSISTDSAIALGRFIGILNPNLVPIVSRLVKVQSSSGAIPSKLLAAGLI